MTDQQTYTDRTDDTLAIRRPYTGVPGVIVNLTGADISEDVAVHIETARLLAMIDAIDPDGVRAYLRETVEPERSVSVTIADLAEVDLADLVDRALRGFDGPVTDPHLPAHIAGGIAEELLQGLHEQRAAERIDAIPEADGPDDMPDLEQARAAGEQIGALVRAFSDAYAAAVKR